MSSPFKGRAHLGGKSENFSAEIFWGIKTLVLLVQTAWRVASTLFSPGGIFSVFLVHHNTSTTLNSLREWRFSKLISGILSLTRWFAQNWYIFKRFGGTYKRNDALGRTKIETIGQGHYTDRIWAPNSLWSPRTISLDFVFFFDKKKLHLTT